MTNTWTECKSRAYWINRRTYAVLKYPLLPRWREQYLDNVAKRRTAEAQKKEDFLQLHDLHEDDQTSSVQTIVEDLQFWAVHCSWSFCNECKLLVAQKLSPSFSKRPLLKKETRCQCLSQRYYTPRYRDIPSVLRGLTYSEMCALRPLDLHNGNYQRQQHGYRKKNAMTRVTWSHRSVLDKIQGIPDQASKSRCQAAYDYLMSAVNCSYSSFITKREQQLQAGQSLNVYDIEQTRGIECALWPSLYPFTSWCETMLSGNEERLSSKVSFMTKVFSDVRDYALQYDLLQFHFDRWLFTTVSGAIRTGATMQCSPARALETKTFSTEYWRWEHRYLLDALRQYGYPTLFITLSPYEWSFPFPLWLEQLRHRAGKGPTELAAFETLSIVNTLEQLVRGYLCGGNDSRWKSHAFHNTSNPTSKNVPCYFYRFEFQDRGTAHLHLLVWLEDVSSINTDLIRGHIPWDDPGMAFLVSDLQKSDKAGLALKNTPTELVERNGFRVIEVYHPTDAFAINLRGYIKSVLPTLKCRMDVQTTDGRSMILRYVTDYVTKWQDAYSNDSLYSTHLTPYMAAYRHLSEMTPCEPEMWLQLTSRKIAWSNRSRKKFVPPRYDGAEENVVCRKYWRRPADLEHISLLDWLRTMRTDLTIPTPYKNGRALVGVKYQSIYKSEFFFQYNLVNHPHRTLQDLHYPTSRVIPDQIKHFAAAVHLQPETWSAPHSVGAMFEQEGHKDSYVKTVVSYVRSLHDIFTLWRSEILSNDQLAGPGYCPENPFPLAGKQLTVLQWIKDALAGRHEYYSSLDALVPRQWSDEPAADDGTIADGDLSEARNTVPWNKFLLVKGKPGTGKTQVLLAAINHCVSTLLSVLVATPTAHLAAQYRGLCGADIMADTIHSAFQVPVSSDARPTVNWNLSTYDVIFIDEMSMVPSRIMHHIAATVRQLPVRPVVVLSGDESQQQPIDTVDNRTVQVENIFSDRRFCASLVSVVLTDQHRCVDRDYEQILQHLRHWPPTDEIIRTLHDGRLLCPSGKADLGRMIGALRTRAHATVLTVSRQAAHEANDAIIRDLYANREPLAVVHLDDSRPCQPIFRGMRVMITQNRSKELAVVNGQEANVFGIEGKTVLLKLPDDRVVSVYPVTAMDREGERSTVLPFVPAYAMTVCKAQGQTLATVIIWFDCDTVPEGTAYVALSRVKCLADLLFFTPMQQHHVKPVVM